MIAIRAFTRSSSFRVGVIFTLLSCAAILFIVYFWYLAGNETLLREARAALDAEWFALEAAYETGGNQALINVVDKRVHQPQNTSIVALADQDGTLLAGNLQSLPDIPGFVTGEIVPVSLFDHVDSAFPELITAGTQDLLVTHRLLGKVDVVIARNVDDLYSAQKIGRSLSWLFVLLLGLIAALSFGVAIYVVNRINRMSDTASNIIRTGNLKDRMEIDSSWDDLSKLAEVFNQMLDRIETSVNNIKRVTDNIAHDLRTPLSRLRGKLEKIENPALREHAINEADNLLAMFNGLLRIADVESERQREAFERVALHTIMSDVIDLYEPLAEASSIQLNTNIQAVYITGDKHLLFQAFTNLVDNSLKYAGQGCQIEITVCQTDARAVVCVNDTGSGSSPEEFASLDRRFYRAEQSRTTPGNGLGLSMVKAIASLHHGQLWFVDDPLVVGQGFGVTMSFPLTKT